MMVMGGSSMPKADCDLMAIMYSAYGIHHIQWLISNDLVRKQMVFNSLITQYLITITCIIYGKYIYYIATKR